MNFDIIEFENMIPETLQDEIEEFHTSSNFAWHYVKDTVGSASYEFYPTTETFETSFFYHLHYTDGKVNSNRFADVKNILYFLEDKNKVKPHKIGRIQSNLTRNVTGYTENNHSAIHSDYEEDISPLKWCSLLYYVNNSDGDTKFFDKNYNQIKSIKPKKGKAVFFNSNLFHAGSNPIKNDVRIVINFIFQVEKNSFDEIV